MPFAAVPIVLAVVLHPSSLRYGVGGFTKESAGAFKSLREARLCSWPTGKADVLLVVYDITDESSFKVLPEVLSQVLFAEGSTPWASVALVGNKYDKESKREVSQCHRELPVYRLPPSLSTPHHRYVRCVGVSTPLYLSLILTTPQLPPISQYTAYMMWYDGACR